jgi:glucosamine--fructose-6-phosphate aminotransferase (isomerizing)
VIGVSQSGETADTISALQYAEKKGATIASIVNNVGTQIPRMSKTCLYTYAGPEIGVAATKTFTTQVLSFTKLAIEVAWLRGIISEQKYIALQKELDELPEIVTTVIKRTEYIIRNLAKRIRYKPSMYFLGTSTTLPIAMEGALKLKEIAYIHAEGYNAAESKHGPIALIEKDFPVLFVAANDETRHHLLGNIKEMGAREAYTIVLHEGDQNLGNIKRAANISIKLPKMKNPELITIPASVVLQLLAYYTATGKNINGATINPDKPRNLAKSVTVA